MDIEVYTVGLVSFSSNVDLHHTQIKASKGCQNKLTIDWGDFQRYGWNGLSPKITKITAVNLQIFNNQYEPILKQLSNVSFPNLTKLFASNNGIVSIQCLVYYDWPQLTQLDLSNNYIISAKPFAKANLKNVETLNLKSNPLAHRQDFYKANFSKIKKIILSNKQQLLSQKKIDMSFDPIMWKIKLQPILQEDKRDRYPRYYEYRGYYGNYNENQKLVFTKYVEQLSQKAISQPVQVMQQQYQYAQNVSDEQIQQNGQQIDEQYNDE